MSELVSIKIDDIPIQVPKGTNIIEAAKLIGIEIPHYCYHPDLSIAGNCRMCQVELKGAPKLVIACNTFATDGMEIFTHRSSQRVAETQAANLEFILKNHPLDCTICDQSGHCKLQDYYFEYSRKGSRLLETKVKKKKAFQIGKHIILDAERCILCSRCVRFLDEVTKTSELAIINRGDKSEIDLYPGRQVNNPFSAVIIDLCPVGALTYSDWRFNSRIWFTKTTDTICVGCSKNCSVKVHERDGKFITIKARYNKEVNKEWLCDEGRFGFERFRQKNFFPQSYSYSTHLKNFKDAVISGDRITLVLSAFLTFEDIAAFKLLAEKFNNVTIYGLKLERSLSNLEQILIKPDYSPNWKTFEKLGIKIQKSLEINEDPGKIGLIGLTSFEVSFLKVDGRFDFIFTSDYSLNRFAANLIPTKNVYEKSGHFINSDGIVQEIRPIFYSNFKSEAEILLEQFQLNLELKDSITSVYGI